MFSQLVPNFARYRYLLHDQSKAMFTRNQVYLGPINYVTDLARVYMGPDLN